MNPTIILVKNMVCLRCVSAVEAILNNASISFQKVIFGEIHLTEPINDRQKESLKTSFEHAGFELIDNQNTRLIEKIKQLVIKRARAEVLGEEAKKKLSVYLSEEVHHEYTYLSSLFSLVESRTIENYFIEQRIEKAKELLIYGELTLSLIAGSLEYSSATHLSTQFKKITGLTPSHFKLVKENKRKSLDLL